jgi:hypothetical protein
LSEFTDVCHGKVVDVPCAKTCQNKTPVEMDSPTLKQALNSNEKELWLQAIPSKFVLKRNRDSGGIVDRYKARLVLLGHLQRPDIDFFETYAPVVYFTAVRVALAIALNQNMEIHHLDVKCAFLNENN